MMLGTNRGDTTSDDETTVMLLVKIEPLSELTTIKDKAYVCNK